MNGYLLVDKPQGWTSFDVVAKVRGILRRQTGQKQIKVGHSGTLDPFATGLLIILVGTYTKRQEEFMSLDKIYDAVLRLGGTSTTGDPEGEITEVSDRVPDGEEVEAVLKKFTGVIEQTPPIYSAIKIAGRKAYELARAGKPVKLKSRKVTIYEIAKIDYEYPRLSFVSRVSSGTYIRSLAASIGEDLGIGAYLDELRRLNIGRFGLPEAVSAEDLGDFETIKNLLKTD